MKDRARRGISVTAEGEGTLAPDLALITFAVSGQGKDLAPTKEDVAVRSSVVLATLRELGVAETDIHAPDVSISPEYDYRKGQKLIGYRVARQMTVKVRDLTRLGEVLDGVVTAGANEVHGAQMSASDPSAADHQALGKAFAAARAKAEVLAAAAGAKLGAVSRIEEETGTGIGPMPRMRAIAAMAEDVGAPTEVTTGEVTVTRRIRAGSRSSRDPPTDRRPVPYPGGRRCCPQRSGRFARRLPLPDPGRGCRSRRSSPDKPQRSQARKPA